METRKEFIKKAALLAGGIGMLGKLPASIQKALTINPAVGSTFLDAEHVVVLMQENRSFDHSYGTLPGVRGFNDPRAIKLPDGKPVWWQTSPAGESYGPFRLDIKNTKSTWMGFLPHDWADQVDARNHGLYDRWLEVKESRNYPGMPLTMGYYNRLDIPFYYALADAFTVCDQHFCSSLTGTFPNRLFLMRGINRETKNPPSQALVLNQDTYVIHGTTFPERLQDQGISWKVYQNELWLPTGLNGNQVAWLSNFMCNMLERFPQFNSSCAPSSRAYLEKMVTELPGQIRTLEEKALIDNDPAITKSIAQQKTRLKTILEQYERSTEAYWNSLSEREKDIHRRAFCTNISDPHYRELETITYGQGDERQTVEVPKGDIFHQFREDVKNGNLPTVSWLVAPERFSDHPVSPWYGAWYVSEAIDILTQNPEVWKKTIFILTYDENDGYFDHVPPFVAPDPKNPQTGRTSESIDPAADFVDFEMDKKTKPADRARHSPVGLGYRVPMVIASPWSRGGCVCSQVYDHTSVLQFLETFLSQKTGKKIEQPEISSWRRAVCGDLTAAFQPYNGEKIKIPFPDRNEFVEEIHRTRLNELPAGFTKLSDEETRAVREGSYGSLLPAQEKGQRRSAPLPYQLYADGALNKEQGQLQIRLAAGNEFFGARSAGSPFIVYTHPGTKQMSVRNYAVAAGEHLTESWTIEDRYHLRIDGPNGFMRELRGKKGDPSVEITVGYPSKGGMAEGSVEVKLVNPSDRLSILIKDNAYGQATKKKIVRPGRSTSFVIDTQAGFGWYDFSVLIEGVPDFERRCAGRVETGQWGYTDPVIGKGKAGS